MAMNMYTADWQYKIRTQSTTGFLDTVCEFVYANMDVFVCVYECAVVDLDNTAIREA